MEKTTNFTIAIGGQDITFTLHVSESDEQNNQGGTVLIGHKVSAIQANKQTIKVPGTVEFRNDGGDVVASMKLTLHITWPPPRRTGGIYWEYERGTFLGDKGLHLRDLTVTWLPDR